MLRRWSWESLRVGVVMLCVVAVLGFACSAPQVAQDPPSPSDRPETFISLVPAITETLVALNATERLTGRSEWCKGDEVLQRVPAMGTLLTPNLEAIALAQPAVVLADGSAAAGIDDLERIARVEVLPWLHADEVAASVRSLGTMVAREEEAERVARGFDALAAAEPKAEAPRVLLALQGSLAQGEIWYIRPDTLHGEALEKAGFRNAVPEPTSGPPVLSLERLLALSPDAIVILSAQAATEEERSAWKEQWDVFTTLEAVKTGKIAVLGGPEILAVGPAVLDVSGRLIEALRSVGVESS